MKKLIGKIIESEMAKEVFGFRAGGIRYTKESFEKLKDAGLIEFI